MGYLSHEVLVDGVRQNALSTLKRASSNGGKYGERLKKIIVGAESGEGEKFDEAVELGGYLQRLEKSRKVIDSAYQTEDLSGLVKTCAVAYDRSWKESVRRDECEKSRRSGVKSSEPITRWREIKDGDEGWFTVQLQLENPHVRVVDSPNGKVKQLDIYNLAFEEKSPGWQIENIRSAQDNVENLHRRIVNGEFEGGFTDLEILSNFTHARWLRDNKPRDSEQELGYDDDNFSEKTRNYDRTLVVITAEMYAQAVKSL